MDEEKYKEELAKEGVDIPELKEKTEPEEKPEPPAPEALKPPVTDPEDKEEESEGDEPNEKKPPLQEKKPGEPRKPRSIYDEYKDKKTEAKTQTDRADKAERERDELQKKLDEAAQNGKDGKPTIEAEEDAIAYAEKIGADPDLVKRILADAKKGIVPPDYDALKKDIDELKNANQKTMEENRNVLEQQAFDEEFTAVLPTLEEYFPSASAEELATMKKELEVLSHKKDWYDKDLDYIVFKNKDTLTAFVTPKKRGMESRERKDIEDNTYEFDPNADLSKMNPAERDKWEIDYRKAGQSDGLLKGTDGEKIII